MPSVRSVAVEAISCASKGTRPHPSLLARLLRWFERLR